MLALHFTKISGTWNRD